MSICPQKLRDAKSLLEEQERLNTSKVTIKAELEELKKKYEELEVQFNQKNQEIKNVDSKLASNKDKYRKAKKIIEKDEHNKKVIAENRKKECYARKCLSWILDNWDDIIEYDKNEILDMYSPSGLDDKEEEFYDFLLTYFKSKEESDDSSTVEELTFDTLYDKYGESTSDIIIESAHLMSFKVKKFPDIKLEPVWRKSDIYGISSTTINNTPGLPGQIAEYYHDGYDHYQFSWWNPYLNGVDVDSDYKDDCIAYKNENDFTIDTTLNDFTFSSIDLWNINAVACGNFTHAWDEDSDGKIIKFGN